MILLRACNVEEDVRKRPDGVGVAAHLRARAIRVTGRRMSEHTAGRAASDHHQVREADVVENRDVARRHAREQPLLPEVDRAHRLEREAVVGEQAVHAQQADEREVPHHLVQRRARELCRCRLACTRPAGGRSARGGESRIAPRALGARDASAGRAVGRRGRLSHRRASR